ncbi:acetyl-CoA synthetase-like protein [Saccharata proteae CBS 121410]|uniref:Acetyl-CoA synthetase-like protein n=1 Tax=Saccharata proteae CBS 121410 TaxID=1314787 RepID=A0A9P4HXQ4_9PEZI|nr:acetyl-CoA synthetase-like protein [Saccharata proteae CBS 121410]
MAAVEAHELTITEHLVRSANASPSRIYASVPLADDCISDGFCDVTVSAFLSAVEACAWWIEDTYGRSNDFDTLAYAGVNDLRYALVLHAAMRCRYKTMFVSPGNEREVNMSLLEQMECKILSYAAELSNLVQDLQKELGEHKTQLAELVPMQYWLERPQKSYHPPKSLTSSLHDPVLVIHSSGTTGKPKPIIITNGYFSTALRRLPAIPNRECPWQHVYQNSTFMALLPPFHLGAVLSMSVYPTALDATIVLAPTNSVVTGILVTEVMRRKKLSILYAVSSIFEEMVRLPDGLELLSRPDYVTFTGGPLAKWCGDELSKSVRVMCVYGSTEAAGAPTLLPLDPLDWPYLEFHPAYGAVFEPSALPNTFELILPPSPAVTPFRPNIWTMPATKDKETWCTGDLFTPHASKAGLWQF